MKVDWNDLEEAPRGSIQSLSAFLVVSELIKLGIKHFIVSPGARSIPLILALQYLEKKGKQSGPKVTLVNDERAAAFMAQGLSKSGTLPCVMSTSGTAVSNYLPGIVEAYYTDTPVVILTADRPWELLQAGANQTINQKNIFNDFVCSKLDIPAPEKELHAHSLLSNIDYLVNQAKVQKKPVHLNVAYRKPFYDNEFKIDADLKDFDLTILKKWVESAGPYIEISENRKISAGNSISKYSDFKPMFVVGPLLDKELITQIKTFSEKYNIPTCADVHSNLRQTNSTKCLSLFNLYLLQKGEDFLTQNDLPNVVYHLGGRMISDVVHEFLKVNNIELVLVREELTRQDAIENEFLFAKRQISISEFVKEVTENKVNQDFQKKYFDLEEATARKVTDQVLLEGMTERNVILSALSAVRENSKIFLSASLIFREADNFVSNLPRDVTFYGNRGATGIDGIISSAIGVVLEDRKPIICIIGDQAALHDISSLALTKELDGPAIFLVINNSGGAIFNFMNTHGLKEILSNPHSLEFSHFAKGFGLSYFAPTSIEELIQSIESAYENCLRCVIEVKTSGEQAVEKLKKI